jgi:hypothetical protein
MKYHVLNLRILRVGIMSGLLWFRVFGRGLHIKDTRRHPLMHSQCTTWLPILTLGPWQVRIL